MNNDKENIKFCSACGTQLEEGAVFCANCGNKVETEPQNSTNDMTENKADTKNKISETPQEQLESPYIPPSELEVEPDKELDNSHYYFNQEHTASAPSAVAPEKKKKKRRQNFFLKLLSFLLALILSAALVLAIPITLLRFLLTDHNIDVIVDRIISSVDLGELAFETAEGSKKLSSVLLDVTDQFEGWDHITEEQINDALLEDFVKGFASDALKQYGMSLKEGEELFGWTPEQIYDFVAANKDTIEALARDAGYTGELPIEEKKDMMIENIEKHIGKDGITVKTVLGDNDEAQKISGYLNQAQILFSDNTLILIWGIVAFIAILLVFTNIGYFGNFLRCCGFPAFIIGAIFFLGSFAADPVISFFKIPDQFEDTVSFVVGFLMAMLKDLSISVLAVGLALIIASFIFDAIPESSRTP